MKTYSGLSAYCHGNVDFPNVWEPTCAIPIYKGAFVIRVSMRLKKEARQVKKKIFHLKRRNIGIANMHKKYRRQDRDPGSLCHIVAR